MPRLRAVLLLCLLSSLGGCGGGGGSTDFVVDETLRIERAYPALTLGSPLVVTSAPGDTTHLYVARQSGVINVFEARADITTAEAAVFLDLRDRTRAAGEQGLLGLAFDPDYTSNGWVYVHYNQNANPDTSTGDTVVARVKANRATRTADLSTLEELFRFPQPFSNHNGGSIAFGPDGKLYIALGDGGSGNDPGNRAQDLGLPLGKILRLNPDGSVPSDNPFVGVAGARAEIWAYGLRNPFRMSFDPGSGRLWVGDVGQGAQEEIDLIRKGGNYGWRVYEGTRSNISDGRPFSAFDAPVFTYGRDQGESITGGVVYRGSRLPFLNGAYVYGDFVSGRVWVLTESGGTATRNLEIGGVPNPSGFGYDLDGEVLITAYDGGLYRLVAAPGASVGAPPARLSATGLFTDLATLTPAADLREYAPNAPFWSDGALKRRWFRLPAGTTIGFDPEQAWTFPIGTTTVKHFEIDTAGGRRRLETRVFQRQASGQWLGYSYLWNETGTDATLLNAGATLSLTLPGGGTQTYSVPDRAQCLQCHTPAAGVVLGLNTRQLNGTYTYRDGSTRNQLARLDELGVFDTPLAAPSSYAALADPADSSAPLSARARAHLETNCAQCHQPGGPTGVEMDLRAATPRAQTGTIGVAATGSTVNGAALRIDPGNKANSLVWQRPNTLVRGQRMPPLSSQVIDGAGVDLIGQWIDAGAP